MPTPEEIALQRIRAAAERGDTRLDLSRLGLTALPPEIGRLTSLQSLDLHGNQFADLPAEIFRLTQLSYLNLAGNQITLLSPEIGNLT